MKHILVCILLLCSLSVSANSHLISIMTDLDVVVFKKNGSQFWVSTNNGCHYTLPSNQPVMVSSDLYLFKHTQLEQRCDGKISTIEDLDKILN